MKVVNKIVLTQADVLAMIMAYMKQSVSDIGDYKVSILVSQGHSGEMGGTPTPPTQIITFTKED